MSTVGFIVDRLHVGTSDRAVIRDFRDRFRISSGGWRWTRERRHAVYREALERHRGNQDLVKEFRL